MAEARLVPEVVIRTIELTLTVDEATDILNDLNSPEYSQATRVLIRALVDMKPDTLI